MAKDSLMNYATSLDPAQRNLLMGKQVITETKYDSVAIPAGVLANQTQFFAAQNADLAVKNFDGNGFLVSNGKLFLAQTLGVLITGYTATVTGQNLIDIINQTALRLQVDQKIMGTFPLHQLTGFGGAYLPSQVNATVAANPIGGVAASGIQNGVTHNQPFRLSPMLIEGQKAFAAFLIGPTGAPITVVGGLTMKVCIGGLQFQAIQ